MKYGICASVASFALMAATPVSAQTAFDPGAQIFDFTESNIAPVLAHRGITVLGRYTGQDVSYVDIKFADGTKGIITFTAKQPNSERRVGMATTIVFESNPNWTINRKVEQVINFNQLNLLTQVGLNGSGQFYILRFSVSDFGIPYGSLSSELQNFELVAKKLKEELAKP
jgi:hypothetical protein